MKTNHPIHHHHRPHPQKEHTFWIVGLGSLLWLLLRSGANPRRLTYPCQRAALTNSLGFLGYLVSLFGGAHLYRRARRRKMAAGAALILLAALFTAVLSRSAVPIPVVYATPALSAWRSDTAVSNLFVVPDVPAPECSLAAGALPDSAPCNDPETALRDDGVDRLVAEMEAQGDYFYRTADHPTGVVGADNVVVIKINNQWGGLGDGAGYGRLSTNTDLLKGLIWRVLQHPDGFSGEVVLAENTQDSGAGWDITPANAEDQAQSYQQVAAAFQSLGWPVSIANWDRLNDNLISGSSVGDSGYPAGEYARGNFDDAYILLEDPAGSGTDELSYPKFQTGGGRYVSMRYGVWDGSGYDAGQLTFINMPVLKKHGMAAATISWKNLIGFITIADTERRFGDWDQMHDFFWGYTGGDSQDYGLIGRQLALVRAPDLNLVDAIWVAVEDNTSGGAVRQNTLLASRDPFAADWYASEYLLRPIAAWEAQDSSAARGGVFRQATRVNQNTAAALWPEGAYPYIDLLDNYDGDAPSQEEINQMNVFLAGETAVSPPSESPPPEPPPSEPPLAEPETVAAVPAAGVIDDFESGAANWEPDVDELGSTLACDADSGMAREGDAALRLDYVIMPDGWGDCGRFFEQAQDWRGGAGLSLWLRADQAGLPLTLMLFSGPPDAPTPFEVYFESTAAWTQFAFPWADFARAEWADEGGLAEPDPAQISGYGFSVGSGEERAAGALWVDDVRLLGAAAAEAPESPTAAVAATAVLPTAKDTAVPVEPAEPAATGENQSGGGLPCAAGALPLALVGWVWLSGRDGRKRDKSSSKTDA